VVTRLVTAPPIDFAALRRELELPDQFPLAAQREADAAAATVLSGLSADGHPDRTDIPLVTIDPAASRDLDQAVYLQRRPDGYRVYYAIADVMAFVPRGGALETETWQRGQTIYLPDGSVPLHPLSLSEGAASLLPGQLRPAVLWTIDLDANGERTAVDVHRVLVRSRAKLDYVGVQNATTPDEAIALLPELGRLLIARGLDRGAINLPIPEQSVQRSGDDGWKLTLRSPVAAEDWNAQISLLTGMCAADIMLKGGLGLLRTMPAPREEAVQALRLAGRALGIEWPDGVGVGRVLATIDPSSPRGAAFVDQAAELMRGAGYTAVDGTPPPDPGHGAVAAPYAHVTAPLRRLADRYATEVCLLLTAGQEVPDWLREALPRLPEVMSSTDHKAAAAQRAAIDLAEAVLLQHRVGEVFEAAVLDVAAPHHPRHPGAAPAHPGGTVAVDDPPVRAKCEGTLPLGARISVRLVTADPSKRLVVFAATGSASSENGETAESAGNTGVPA
jgi:exoribonuclease R